MSLTDGSLSAADIAAVTGSNGGFGNWGGDGAWWLLVLFLFILHLNNLGIEVGDDFLTVLNLLSQQRRLLHGCLLVGLRLLQQFLGVGYFVFDFLLVLLELSAALPTLRKSLNRQKQQSQQTQQTDRFLTISGLKFLHI